MGRFSKWILAAVAILGLSACDSDGKNPYGYWTGGLANTAWQKDQSQMRGMLYASTFAADVKGDPACDKLPETVTKTVAYETAWDKSEFVIGYLKKCHEFAEVRLAVKTANEAKAMVAAKPSPAKAKRHHRRHRMPHCDCSGKGK